MVTQRYFFTNPAPAEFLEKYPNDIVIIDATELKLKSQVHFRSTVKVTGHIKLTQH